MTLMGANALATANGNGLDRELERAESFSSSSSSWFSLMEDEDKEDAALLWVLVARDAAKDSTDESAVLELWRAHSLCAPINWTVENGQTRVSRRNSSVRRQERRTTIRKN